MPGIPSSNRCQFCKRRKIKCDEAWPRCGNCKRSNQVCSGPPTGVKFVQNNCHSVKGNSSKLGNNMVMAANQAPSPSGTLVDVKLQSAADGSGAFHQMKIVRDPPPRTREVSPTSEEKIAAKLAQCMATSETSGFGLLMSHEVLGSMAQRVSESVALIDAMNCLLATFSNLRRAKPFQDLIDLQTYGKALKSLQKAYKDSDQQYTTATLAAATLLYRIEVAYDSSKGPNKSLHCSEIYGLMSSRGPPSLQDELDIYLAFENQRAMLSYCLLSGEDNFYALPEWTWTLQGALDSGLVISSSHYCIYSLNMIMSKWPYLAQLLQALQQDPLNSYSTEVAMELMEGASSVLQELQAIDDTRIAELKALGDIFLVVNPGHPCNHSFEFIDRSTAEFFSYHAMTCIAVNRIHRQAMEFFGPVDHAVFESLNNEWSSRIWRSYTFAQRCKPVGSTFLVPPLIFSFESAGPAEQEMVTDALLDLEKYRNPPKSRWAESGLLETCMALTGRAIFTNTQQAGAELWG